MKPLALIVFFCAMCAPYAKSSTIQTLPGALPHVSMETFSGKENARSEMILTESLPSRRRALAGIAGAIGSLAINPCLSGQQAATKEAPAAANKARTSIHQEIDLKAPPGRIFEILMDEKQFAAVTGMPAEIDPKAGGAFKTFGAQIEGRNVELIPGQRVVQAWRPAAWLSGVYSIVHFELAAYAKGTYLILDHTGFPEGLYDHLLSGWNEHYWEPFKKHLK
jgi:activator of HSP90 ATPase